MKFVIFLCVFHLTTAQIRQSNVEGQASWGVLPEAVSWPTYMDYVETSNLKLFLRLIRRMAPVGIHELPPFDPFTDNIDPIEISLPGIEGNVTISNIKVVGMEKYSFPNLLLQAQSLQNQEDKLLTFTHTLPELNFEFDIKAIITTYYVKTIIDLGLSGQSTGITNSGKLGLSKVVLNSQEIIGGSRYQIDSYDINTSIEDVTLHIVPRQGISNRANIVSAISPNDLIVTIISNVMVKEINKYLLGILSIQVDAFLRAGVPEYFQGKYVMQLQEDSIVIELDDLDGKSKYGNLPQAYSEPDNQDELDTQSLNEIVELSRRIASTGMHSVPIFEPYNAGSLETIVLGQGLGRPKLTVSDLVVEGLQLFANTELSLQSQNLTIDNSRLLSFVEQFRSLRFEANIKWDVGEVATAKVRGVATNVINNGSLGIEVVPKTNPKNIGELVYAVTSFDLENRIKHLRLEITDIKMNVGSSIPSMAISSSDIVQELADKFSLVVGKAAQKQFNVILDSFTPEQVDAFLAPGWGPLRRLIAI